MNLSSSENCEGMGISQLPNIWMSFTQTRGNALEWSSFRLLFTIYPQKEERGIVIYLRNLLRYL